MEITYQVYLLENESGKHYIGLSEDIALRLIQHNAGESKWTAKFRPWKIIWSSFPMTRTEALILEKKMKRQKGGKGLRTLMQQFQQPTGS